MSLPGDASLPAIDPRKLGEARDVGRTLMRLLEEDVRPRDIMTKQAFENAITVGVAMGGSTNIVLHLLAIANEAGVPLGLEDFERISASTPYIADMKPAGRYVMADLSRYGGIALVMKRLLNAGLLHGDAMTITGKTVAENLEGITVVDDQPIISQVDTPRSPTGGLAILRRQPGPGRRGHQGGRPPGEGVPWPPPASSTRREPPSGPPGRPGQGRGHCNHPLRRPQGRPGNAGDAGGNLRHRRPGPG